MIRFLASLMTFAFVALIAASGGVAAKTDYLLRAGDTLRVEVLEDPALNRTLLIAPDGRISMPQAGGVAAAGRTIESLQADLVSRLSANFAQPPNVYVALERQKERAAATGGASAAQAAGVDVFVMGEAAKPGRMEVKPGTTVLQLFAQMGGFSKFAAIKRIQLRRGNEIMLLNYKEIEAGTSQAGAIVVFTGDVIVVPQRKLFE